MNDAAWDRLIDGIDLKFGIEKHGTEERPLEDATHLTAAVQFIEFERGGEPYRLERVTGPAIIDRKTIGSRRVGSDVRFENVYDPQEQSSKVTLLRRQGGDWVAAELTDLGGN